MGKKDDFNGSFRPEDWDGDGKIDDYDEMMELRMFEKISKIVAQPGFDIFDDDDGSTFDEEFRLDEDEDEDEFDDDNDLSDSWDDDNF